MKIPGTGNGGRISINRPVRNADIGLLGYNPRMHQSCPDIDSGTRRRSFVIRKAALSLLEGVRRKGKMLSESAPRLGDLTELDRSRALFLAETALRWQGRSDHVLKHMVKRQPHPAGLEVLRLAISEIHALGSVPELVVDQAVRLIKDGKNTRHLAGLANAVLRKAAGKAGRENWHRARPQRLPDWIGAPVSETHGEDVRRNIEAAHELVPPLDLTPVNAEVAVRMQKELGGILLSTGSLRLPGRARVSELPGYGSGSWWVQDAAASVPVRLLGSIRGLDVLDICAAPGGKTLQCAAAGANVTAIDISDRRLGRLRENLCRTGLTAVLQCADALDWDPGRAFDVVVVDAPCTATGTIRRHPDLPHVRSGGEKQLHDLAQLQRSLLSRAAALTRRHGFILYSVCSLLRSEGEERVTSLAQELNLQIKRLDCRSLGVEPDWQVAEGGVRTRPDHLPKVGGMDGFYSAVLRKL